MWPRRNDIMIVAATWIGFDSSGAESQLLHVLLVEATELVSGKRADE